MRASLTIIMLCDLNFSPSVMLRREWPAEFPLMNLLLTHRVTLSTAGSVYNNAAGSAHTRCDEKFSSPFTLLMNQRNYTVNRRKQAKSLDRRPGMKKSARDE
jgi:hypothetical protein